MPPGISGLKRHPALVPLSRDHHGALVRARALRLAAAGTDAERHYDVRDEPERVVVVKAIGIKTREKVLAGGLEIDSRGQ